MGSCATGLHHAGQVNEKLHDSRSRDEEADASFEQGDAIRDYVFPLFEVEQQDASGLRAGRFLGTGFFVGQRNLALTAAHVLRSTQLPVAVALVDGDSGWRALAVRASEEHPTEDVAVMMIEPPTPGGSWVSMVRWSTDWVGSSLPYHLWGYPEDAAYELVEGDQAVLRPDLVYSEGHIRRRLSGIPLPMIQGSKFFELSDVAGAGCSGSPVLHRRPGQMWELVAVYVGERVNERATSVGYAVRIEEIGEWVPELVGRSILQEANNVASPSDRPPAPANESGK